jgi:hypothetical protein
MSILDGDLVVFSFALGFGGQMSRAMSGVGAGLVLLRPSRGLCFRDFLALLATVLAFALGRGFGHGQVQWSGQCNPAPTRALRP